MNDGNDYVQSVIFSEIAESLGKGLENMSSDRLKLQSHNFNKTTDVISFENAMTFHLKMVDTETDKVYFITTQRSQSDIKKIADTGKIV